MRLFRLTAAHGGQALPDREADLRNNGEAAPRRRAPPLLDNGMRRTAGGFTFYFTPSA